jgi:hypothetical protein
MDPALCFLAMRLDRSMGSNSQAADTPGIDDVVRRIGMAGIDAITTQALADQALTVSTIDRAWPLDGCGGIASPQPCWPRGWR